MRAAASTPTLGGFLLSLLCQKMLSKKVLQFILLTFLISWSVAGATYLLHITYGSIPSLLIIAVCYMPAPAFATLILQKVIYRGTLTPYGFTVKNLSLRWLLITTVGFAWFLVLGTFGVIGILGNVFGVALFGRIDFSEVGSGDAQASEGSRRMAGPE